MSIKLTTMALETPYKPTPKVVLIVYCDFSNDDGICFPSNKIVSKKATVSNTTLTYVKGAFKLIGLLKTETRKRENGSDQSSRYFINIEKLEEIASIEQKIKKKFLNALNISEKDLTEKQIRQLQNEIKKEKEKYLNEYQRAYDVVKDKKREGSLSDPSSKQKKNHKVTPRGHQGDPLEPSINHQREDINISPLSKRADFLKSQNSFINYMRATFKNKTIATTDQYTGKKIQVAISDKGYLYDKITGESFSGTRALEMWEKLYEFAIQNPLAFQKQNEEETA